jgi:hypothetical protein
LITSAAPEGATQVISMKLMNPATVIEKEKNLPLSMTTSFRVKG